MVTLRMEFQGLIQGKTQGVLIAVETGQAVVVFQNGRVAPDGLIVKTLSAVLPDEEERRKQEKQYGRRLEDPRGEIEAAPEGSAPLLLPEADHDAGGQTGGKGRFGEFLHSLPQMLQDLHLPGAPGTLLQMILDRLLL